MSARAKKLSISVHNTSRLVHSSGRGSSRRTGVMSLNAAPEPAYETFEDGAGATTSRCSIKRLFTRRCACLLCVLVTGLVVGGGCGAIIALSMNQQQALPSPFLPRCGSCATGPLEGKFSAHVSEDAPFGGVSYDVRRLGKGSTQRVAVPLAHPRAMTRTLNA